MDRTTSPNSIGQQLKKVESQQYPATHLGHLSQDQAQKLESFKNIARDKGYYTPETPKQRASHDDETMLRYLRARKFQPQDAFGQFKDTEDWRKSNKIDNLYETIDVEDYDETRKLYPQWTGRRDKRGIPVYTFEIAPLNSKRMSAYEKSISKKSQAGNTSPKLIRLFALYENLLQFTMPLCSGIPDRPYAETPVSQSNNIVDIAGVGLKQFWNLKQHMQDASTLATAHYPETLDRIFVIGAPSFFPTVWGWVKGWFDPITVSKIFILSKQNMKSTLEMYIDPSNIPRKYGGTLDWEWGDLPTLEPAISKALEWESPSKNKNGEKIFPSGPIKWRTDENGDMIATAVGSVNGKQRETRVAKLPVQQGLELGPVASRLGVQHRLFGEPSTSGTHTHPEEGTDYFPTSGVTPPEEHDDKSLHQALSSEDNHTGSIVGRGNGMHDKAGPTTESAAVGGAAVGGAVAGRAVIQGAYNHSQSQNANVPSHSSSSDQHRSQEPGPPARSGTSSTRYNAQSATRADGQLSNSTPDKVDHGYGDKTATIEPTTVGQAHKNVDVPEVQPFAVEEHQAGYLEQARNAAAEAATTVTGAGSAALGMIGLGGAAEQDSAPSVQGNASDGKVQPEHQAGYLEQAQTAVTGAGSAVMAKVGLGGGSEHETAPEEKEDLAVREKPEDPRIDKMEDKDVEAFIRSQYATSKPKHH